MDWSKEQHADPLCRATIAYLRRGCPVPFPSDVLTGVSDSLGVRIAPQKEDVLELARKGVLVDILNDVGEAVPLFVRKPSSRKSSHPTCRVASLLQDEPTRIFVHILL